MVLRYNYILTDTPFRFVPNTKPHLDPRSPSNHRGSFFILYIIPSSWDSQTPLGVLGVPLRHFRVQKNE